MYLKYNLAFVWLFIFCFSFINPATLSLSEQLKNEGSRCALCTFGLGLLEQLGQVHKENISQTLQRVCTFFHNSLYRQACKDVIKFINPILIELLYHHYTPDMVCAVLKICPKSKDGRSPRCHLFPLPTDEEQDKIAQGEEIVMKHFPDVTSSEFLPPLCKWPGVQYVCDLYYRMKFFHAPIVDLDSDGFSTTETFRGSAWRGRDCNDLKSSVHPGAKPVNHDVEYDSDCNGIYGTEPETGEPYEKRFCDLSGSRGLMLIGDSAGAHFHFPEQWLDARRLNADILMHLPYALSNEMDWPMASFSTGYRNMTWPIVDGYTVSVYDFLKRRNRCNHRDYHNFGVNGASSFSPPSYLNRTIRSQTLDKPLLVFYEFVGNDVCNRKVDTLAHMTTPKEMRQNLIKTLDRLVNPCNGWMTSNDTLRMLTTKRAFELSDVIRDFAKEFKYKYKHFDLEYISCPLTKIAEEWVSKRGKLWQLIESTDGFHPNQLANRLIAKNIWSFMEKHVPHFIGHVNPYNQRIADIFGDQGGY